MKPSTRHSSSAGQPHPPHAPSPPRRGPDPFAFLCEACGYHLAGIADMPACPECGTPISDSLPARREGSPWQKRRSIASALATDWALLRHPIRFWRVVRLHKPISTGLLIANITLSALIPTLALTLVMRLPTHRLNFAYLPFFFMGGVLIYTVLSAVEFLGLPFFAARRGWRVPIDAAFVIIAHASAGWLISGVGVALAYLAHNLLQTYAPAFASKPLVGGVGGVGGGGGFSPANMLLVAHFVLFLVGVVAFSLLSGAGWQALRFANRLPPQE